jgi:hypothetical protein
MSGGDHEELRVPFLLVSICIREERYCAWCGLFVYGDSDAECNAMQSTALIFLLLAFVVLFLRLQFFVAVITTTTVAGFSLAGFATILVIILLLSFSAFGAAARSGVVRGLASEPCDDG